MSDDVKLLPCPFCGGIAIRTNFESMHESCISCSCGASSRTEQEKSEAVEKNWNRRALEPGTSVIRWTRYDGTPETLPEEGRIFLISPKAAKLIIPVFAVVYNETFTLNMTTPVDSEAHIIEKKAEMGDLWAYLPEPPEGIE